MAQSSADGQARGCKTNRALGIRAGLYGARDRYPLQLFEKIQVKKGTTKLAVGDALEPDRLLFAHGCADLFVFDHTQRLFWDLSLKKALARRQQGGGTQ